MSYSDSTGAYELRGAAEGLGSVYIAANGYVGQAKQIYLISGPCVSADFLLKPARTISFAVTTRLGAPIPDAQAHAQGVRSSKADEKGIIQLTLGKDAVPFSCEVGAPGCNPVSLTLNPNAPPSRVILQKAGYEFSGIVLDEAGAPVNGATASIMGLPAPCGAERNTDASGRFSVPLLCPPAVSVRVKKAGYIEHTERIEAHRASSPFITVIKKCNAEVNGRVVDIDGKPVTRFRITLNDGSAFYNRDFDDDGSFRITDVPPGSYSVSVVSSPKILVRTELLFSSSMQLQVLTGKINGPLTIMLNPPNTPKK